MTFAGCVTADYDPGDVGMYSGDCRYSGKAGRSKKVLVKLPMVLVRVDVRWMRKIRDKSTCETRVHGNTLLHVSDLHMRTTSSAT